MKERSYTYRLEENGYLFLYNAATDQVRALLPQVATLYKAAADRPESLADRPESLADRHPELYDSLCSGGFFVADDADEPAAFIASLEERERADRSFGIIVNPPLRCNLRCWYCYEKHDHLTDMPQAVREAVCRLVDRVAADGRHDRLNLSFFGGEPLLPFADVVRPILRHTADVCARLCFEERPMGAALGDVLYEQPSMGGHAVVTRNPGGKETPLNLELLFNALLAAPALRDLLAGKSGATDVKPENN